MKSTPKTTAEHRVFSTSLAKGAAPAFGVQWRNVLPQWRYGKELGLAVVSSLLNTATSKDFQQQSGAGVKSDPKARKAPADRPSTVL